MALAFACSILPALDPIRAASPASPQASQYSFDIPAEPITAALTAFSSVTRLSVGWANGVVGFRSRAVRGTMSADEALRRLLDGSGFRARRVTPTAFLIDREVRSFAPLRPNRAPVASRTAERPIVPGDIVVTGQKRPQYLNQVPASLSTTDADATPGRLTPETRDVALSVEGLALTNLGPGRNRLFIRGVADSPFNGPSQSTVAVQLDEARVTFDAPDPDLRLVDIERIEVLKGPQGPLYGSGALGGIYQIVTRKPDLTQIGGSVRLASEAVQHGGIGFSTEGVVNLPLVAERLSVRAVGYGMREGGWIDNAGRDRSANATHVTGARMGLRWQPAPNWMIDLAGALQDVTSADSQYVTASDDTLTRNARIPEPAENDFRSVAATIQGRIGELTFLGTSSYIAHHVDFALDSTPASANFGFVGPTRFFDAREYNLLNQEIRLSSAGSTDWIAGLSYLRANSHSVSTITGPDRVATIGALDRRVVELAMFGERSARLTDRLSATAGARLSRTTAEDQAIERAGGSADRITKTIISPSFALSWRRDDRNLVFLRYARALRPGGLASAGEATTRRFDADDLGTVDLGYRGQPIGRDLSVSGNLFFTVWNHIQSDYLLPDGLVATRNAGSGRIYGIEAGVDWRPGRGLALSAGATWLDAKLTSTEDGVELDDRRLPIAPNASARLSAQYGFAVGRWAAVVSGQANYIGRARLAFDPSLDRTMGDYASLAVAARFTRDRLVLGGRIDNLLDVKGDTFAFGNPFSILNGRQYTPLRPRTLTLSIARAW